MLGRTLAGDEIYCYGKSIVVKFAGKRHVISTGPINGGYHEDLTSVFNHDLNPPAGLPKVLRAPTYEEHMILVAKDLGLEPKRTTGLGTSVPMENASIKRNEDNGLEVTAIATAGVEINAGRAGDPAAYDERYLKNEEQSGTINLILLLNINLTPGALARTLITITEAKTAALQELMIDSRYSHGLATGTGTDGIIAVCNAESQTVLTNAGKHTKLGELIGRTVKDAVKEALFKQTGLCAASQYSMLRRWRRYGLTTENLWQHYCLVKHTKKLDRHTFLKRVSALDQNDALVVYSSLYLHLLDQYAWGLIHLPAAKEAAETILTKLQQNFALNCQWPQQVNTKNFLSWAVSSFTDLVCHLLHNFERCG
ncbi:MAG: adenosylcobinamide amidohydrolase [Firmicutes bacterium]|nr:adenosylcobinamide amidohydrolase [Bacillota bacterium]